MTLLSGCYYGDPKVKSSLSEFPWEKVPDWMPYSENDTIRLSNQNMDTLIYVVESVNKSYEPYTLVKKPAIPCNCYEGPKSEIASIEYHLNPCCFSGADESVEYEKYIVFQWKCQRDLYVFKCLFESSNNTSNVQFQSEDLSDEYDFNAIFDLLPDTLTFENSSYSARIVAGKGLEELIDSQENEIWKIIEK